MKKSFKLILTTLIILTLVFSCKKKTIAPEESITQNTTTGTSIIDTNRTKYAYQIQIILFDSTIVYLNSDVILTSQRLYTPNYMSTILVNFNGYNDDTIKIKTIKKGSFANGDINISFYKYIPNQTTAVVILKNTALPYNLPYQYSYTLN